MTFSDLENTVDRLEHALADLPSDVREPIDLISSELIRMAAKLIVINGNLDHFIRELKESGKEKLTLTMCKPSRN